MHRVQALLQNREYLETLQKINDRERTRLFCKHDINHFLSVARIAMLINLEESYGVAKEYIYVTALLHDIGRMVQYETSENHADAGARIAAKFLSEIAFSKEEVQMITKAIISHGDESVKEEKNLRGLLYRADKLSRECYFCNMQRECDWQESKKNLRLEY